MIALPAVFFLLAWRCLFLRGAGDRARGGDGGAREAFLAAAVFTGALLVVATELLTVFAALRPRPLAAFWALACAAAAVTAVRTPAVGPVAAARPALPLSATERLMAGGTAFILAVVALIALTTPPNTFDSMTYHMARVAHWAQNGGVMNYPANIIRQLVYPPFAEYAVLHGYVLSGGDRFVNMVQWSAMAGSAVAVSLVARELGAARAGQIAAALAAVTVPMVILQGSSTQNDLVAGFWVVTLAAFVLLFLRSGGRGRAAGAGTALALGAMTKGTGLMFGAPFIAAAFIVGPRPPARRWWPAAAACLALALLGGPFTARLSALGGSPFRVMSWDGEQVMGRTGPAETVSNVLRNGASELMLPWKAWNTGLAGAVAFLHRPLGLGTADPRTTAGETFSLDFYLDEDHVSAPLHALALAVTAALAVVFRRRMKGLGVYGAALAVGVLLFGAVVRWQPWINRFHVPLMLLAAPLLAAALSRVISGKWLAALLGVFLLTALYPLFFNNIRYLLPRPVMVLFTREQIMFAKHPWEYPLVTRVTGALRAAGCNELGLQLAGNDWEYPWQAAMGRRARVEQVNVGGPSAGVAYPLGPFTPCAVVARAEGNAGERTFNGHLYGRVVRIGAFDLFWDPRRVPAR